MIAALKLALLTFMSLLFGAVPATKTTKYEVGPGRYFRDYSITGTTAGQLSKTDYDVIDLPLLAYATGTGSTNPALNYVSICVPNPLVKLSTTTGSGQLATLNRGSGAILEAIYSVKKGPANIGGDITFVKSCTTGSGSTKLIDNVCSGTGCVSAFIANGATLPIWNGADFIALHLRGNPTTAFRATLKLLVTDVGAE